MKTVQFFFLIAILLAISGLEHAKAQSLAEDTVWTKKTDQSLGFFQVKFSDNDSIIVGHGYGNDLFFEAKTGKEIARISGNNEVHFIDNDNKFIRLNDEGSKIEIFDINSWQVIDTLVHDGLKIYPLTSISNNKRYFVAVIQGSLRIWDIETKQILITKNYKNEENLYKFNVEQVKFTCNDNAIICTEYKEYVDPENPNNPYSKLNHVIYNFNTLDSIDAIIGKAYFRLSNTCSYISFKRSDPTYGVEIYDFNTKELLWKIPINGPSLTGIEFSPDDKYLVTSPTIQIWDIESKKQVISYQSGTSRNIAISHDGKYIISSIGRYLFNWFAMWEGTYVEENADNSTIIYPNPTNGIVTINFTQQLPEITNISLTNINGAVIRDLFNNFLESGQQSMNFEVSDLVNGSYFINVSNSHLNLFFKLIINK